MAALSRMASGMKKRLDAAIEYADKNPGTVFVLSGWKGKDEPIPEAQAMADYLIFNGVPPERLLLEIQSGNTYENISYSLALIDRIAEEKRGRRGPVPTGLKLDGPVLHAEEDRNRRAGSNRGNGRDKGQFKIMGQGPEGLEGRCGPAEKFRI